MIVSVAIGQWPVIFQCEVRQDSLGHKPKASECGYWPVLVQGVVSCVVSQESTEGQVQSRYLSGWPVQLEYPC